MSKIHTHTHTNHSMDIISLFDSVPLTTTVGKISTISQRLNSLETTTNTNNVVDTFDNAMPSTQQQQQQQHQQVCCAVADDAENDDEIQQLIIQGNLPTAFDDKYPYARNDGTHVTERASILFSKTVPFFLSEDGREYLLEMKNILSRKSSREERVRSIRLLEWFVITYSKRNCTHYLVKKLNTQRNRIVNTRFIVHQSYRECLGIYHKKYFDPFRRGVGLKFIFGLENDPATQFVTCLKQLIFFKWAFENGIIDYVKRNRKILIPAHKSEDEMKKAKKRKINKNVI